MRIFQLGRRVSGAVAAVLLANCGSSVFQTPGGHPNGTLARSSFHAKRAASWVSQDASRATLLSVTDANDNFVYLISLPSGKLIGRLTGFDQPTGDCSDASGDVFITDSQASEVLEYKHASKSAFNVVADHPNIPTGCSVDPTTGNLAVANCCGETTHSGSFAIYKHAKGEPKYYRDPSMYVDWFCTYDGLGDLFVSGINSGYSFQIDELPAGSQKVEQLTLDPVIAGDVSPAILWDGTYLAIESPGSGEIYQYAVGGSVATLVHTISLRGFSGVSGPFWVASKGGTQTLYATVSNNSISSVGILRYPRGGKAIEDLYDVVEPFAVTLSLAQK
ncbi:MAG TPA: hypothetical protein VKR56_12765 [Candidatus Cybelea sp.]|nr:hypothetical protein [Candidatus Cybelea sp.]